MLMYNLGEIKTHQRLKSVSTRNCAYRLRNCVPQNVQNSRFSRFIHEHQIFLNKLFLIGTILFFNGLLKHHTEYLFSFFSYIGLTFRGPQVPYVFSGMISFRLICACPSHLYFTLRFSRILLLQVLLKTQNCVSDILFQL